MDNIYKIINGNSLEELDKLEENSIGSIITDPPYELGFMGKKWDSTGIAYNVELWKKALRVLKPGGYLCAFGGTRTFHRIACAIEDAGFEIRDTMMWIYGSGFPKSHNVGLDIDKLKGCEDRGYRIATASRTHPDGTIEPNGENLPKYEGKTEECKKWEGFGTALKPAFEPIIVARKPIENTVAQNCLKWGVGAINIDECRIYGDSISTHDTKKGTFAGKVQAMPKWNSKSDGINIYNFGKHNAERIEYKQHEGRFPANIITDGSDEVARGMPNDELRYFYSAKASKKDRDNGLDEFEEMQTTDGCIRTNSETAGKFGANSTLRKNIHPTVKPVELMQYLVRLYTPKGETILDIFNGSGSTGKAVAFENRERDANYKYIGIELNKDYCEISKARIDYALNKYEYEFRKEQKGMKEKGQMLLFEL